MLTSDVYERRQGTSADDEIWGGGMGGGIFQGDGKTSTGDGETSTLTENN